MQEDSGAKAQSATSYTTEDGSVLLYKDDSSTTVKIVGYESLSSDLIIPSEINGKAVIAIGDLVIAGTPLPNSTFANAKQLESVYIPDSVGVISGLDFEGCSNLKSVRMSNKLAYLGMGSFSECVNLSSIDLPDSLLNIDQVTFMGCTSLTSIRIPAKVQSIGSGAFGGCSNLSQIDFLGTSLQSIAGGAFQGTAIESIVLPKGLEQIAPSSFIDCPNLNYIFIPSSIKEIAQDSFDRPVLIQTDNVLNRKLRDFALGNSHLIVFGNLFDYRLRCDIARTDYMGSPIEATFSLTNFNVDFPREFLKVEYLNNLMPGTATIIASSDYILGEAKDTFYIDHADISDATITNIPPQPYVGETPNPDFELTYLGKKLVEGTDFTASYKVYENSKRASLYCKGIGGFKGTLIAEFDLVPKLITITFESNDGTDVPPLSVEYSDFLYADSYLDANEPTRGFSEFQGWYTNEELTKPLNLVNDFPKEDITVYAKWREENHLYPFGFIDVNSTTPHADHIKWLGWKKISLGWQDRYGNHEYRPYSDVARADMAAFLYRLAGSPNYSPKKSDKSKFIDVSDSTPHSKEIWWLASTGISEGWGMSNGTTEFRPYEKVTRTDMAAFLYRLAGSPNFDPNNALEKRLFSDVSRSTPHHKEVLWLANMQISTGWTESTGKKTFRPYLNVARADMAAFMHRMVTNGVI